MSKKKVHEETQLVAAMTKQLLKLQRVIENMEEKRGKIFIEWLDTQSTYLKWEEKFDPSYLRSYRRGEVVLAHFGFNVGVPNMEGCITLSLLGTVLKTILM